MTRRRSLTALAVLAAATGGAVGPGAAGARLRQGGGGSSTILVAFGGPGQGRPVATYNIPVTITGQLSIKFRGDRAAGCGRWGLCAYEGLLATPRTRTGAIQLSEFRRHGRRVYQAALFLNPALGGIGFASHTLRLVNGSVSGLCADMGQNLIFTSSQSRAGRLTLRLVEPGGEELATRCAGPLDADVARATPQASVTVHRLLAGGGEIRLTGDHRFFSHGFAGRVISTIVLRLGAAHRQRSTAGPPKSKQTVRLRTITERFDLIRSAGGLKYAFRGSANPTVCQLLDTCGLEGTAKLGPVPTHAVAELSVTAPARRPRRDLLTALGLARGGNPAGLVISGLIQWRDRGSLAEAVTQSGTCANSAPLQSGFVSLMTRGSAIHATYVPSGPLRTRCPGPMLGIGDGQPPGEVLSKRAVTRSRFTVAVRPPSSLLDDGYLIHPSGQISLTLKRTGHTTERVFTAPKNLASVYTHSPG